jgi:hypothetical protein
MRSLLAALAALLLALPAAAQAPSASHRAAARDLLASMDMERTFLDAMEMQLAQSPIVTQGGKRGTLFAEVMREFSATYMPWDSLAPMFEEVYAARFTEAEMRAIAAFHRTPAGRKLVASQVEMMGAVQARLAARMEALTPVLTQMMQEKMGDLAEEEMEAGEEEEGAEFAPKATYPTPANP